MQDNNAADSGVGVCLSEESHILDIPKDKLPRRTCSHTIGITSTVRHNDRLSLTLRTRNSGYIKINNYDQENVVTVDDAKFYSEHVTEKTTDILFDFAAPQHCIATSSACVTNILDIGDPYTRNSDITVTWEPADWNDIVSGIDHYDCEVYRLTSNPSGSGLLGMRTGAPHASEKNIDRTLKSVQLNLPDTGIFAVILTVTDAVGNSAKARRFLTYDPDSVISVDKDKPITASEGAFNAGFVWLTRSKGDITVTWSGHFFNAFYRDGKFLNGIEEHDPPLGPYDESSGLPPSSRSRQAIPNDNGIVRFQFDFAESSSGRYDPENWVDIDEGKSTHTISVTDDNNEYITIWMKAFDVMDNMKEEKTKFYVDKTNPEIRRVTVVNSDSVDSSSSSSRSKRSAPAGSGVSVEAHDDESGILEIRWQVIDKKDSNRVYGEGKIEETSPGDNPDKPCTGLTCACLPHDNVCFYLEYLVAIDTTQLSDFPNGKTECVVRITVVNNAMLVTSDEVEMSLGFEPSTGSSAGAAAGATISVLLIIAIIVVIAIFLFRRGTLTKWRQSLSDTLSLPRRQRNVSSRLPFSNARTKTDGLDNLSYEQHMQAGTSVNNYTEQQKVMNTSGGNDSAMSRDEMEFSSNQLVLKDKLKPGIHKAKATNIAGKKGDSLVAVKALKDVTSKTQREHLLNELDIMLSIIPHDNIIRLLGCITQSGSPKPSIIMEFAPFGNLGEVLKRSTRQNDDVKNGDDEDIYAYTEVFESKNSLTSEQLMLFAEQIVIGLEHLASLKIIHRKLGVRNVLLGDGKVCKISSFSHAIRSDKETVKDSLGGRLPIRWMAPESLVSTEFSLKSDVWTYGIVLWEIITLGALPYPGLVNKEISEHIKHGQRMGKPPHCTDEIYSLMLKCWSQKPRNRPSCAEILAEIRRITKNEEVIDLGEYDGELYGDVNDL
ncbi:uncharacterized protein [Ptychodera flava]|uniref:uncharacterized protein n=1 Tax=Ptychodera flava TaxID=63121 RepID=UPI003969C5DA